MPFNENLVRLRKQNGLTQEEIAEFLHISRQSVSKWELGLTEPSLGDIKRLSQILNCSVEELVSGPVVKTLEDKNLKRVKRTVEFTIFLLVVVLLTGGIIVAWSPDRVPAHMDINFNIDRYGSRYESLLLPGIVLFCSVGTALFAFFYSRRHPSYFNSKSIIFLVSFIAFILLLMTGLELFLGIEMNFKDGFRPKEEALYQTFLIGLGSLLMIIALASHPFFCPPNLFFGLRTRYTLSSPERWTKANSVASYIFSGVGFAIYISGLFVKTTVALFVGLGLMLSGLTAILLAAFLISKKDLKYQNEKR